MIFETMGSTILIDSNGEKMGWTSIVLNYSNITIRCRNTDTRKIKIVLQYKLDRDVDETSRELNLFIIYFLLGFFTHYEFNYAKYDVFLKACEKKLKELNSTLSKKYSECSQISYSY
jgi:hypothetical protein